MIIVVSHSYIFLYKRWLTLSYSKRFSKFKHAKLLEAFPPGLPPGLWLGPAGGLPDPLMTFPCLWSLTSSIGNTRQCYDIKCLEKPLLCHLENMPIILCLKQVRKPTRLWWKYEVITQIRSTKIFYIDHFGGIFQGFLVKPLATFEVHPLLYAHRRPLRHWVSAQTWVIRFSESRDLGRAWGKRNNLNF